MNNMIRTLDLLHKLAKVAFWGASTYTVVMVTIYFLRNMY